MKRADFLPLVINMMSVMMVTSLLLMTSSRAEGLNDLCPDICQDPDVYALLVPTAVHFCHCAQHMHLTTKAQTTTTDICDYLCSIQLGGQACTCSRPSLPGRK